MLKGQNLQTSASTADKSAETPKFCFFFFSSRHGKATGSTWFNMIYPLVSRWQLIIFLHSFTLMFCNSLDETLLTSMTRLAHSLLYSRMNRNRQKLDFLCKKKKKTKLQIVNFMTRSYFSKKKNAFCFLQSFFLFSRRFQRLLNSFVTIFIQFCNLK